MKTNIKITDIKNLLKECQIYPSDRFLTDIFSEVDDNYFVIKAYEQLLINKSNITRDQLIDAIKILLLAVLKKDQLNGTKDKPTRGTRSKDTKQGS